MAWIFFPALVESPLPSDLGLNQSPIANAIGIVSQSSYPEWKRGYFPSLQSGTMSPLLTESSSEERLTSSTEDSLAKTFRVQDAETAWAESVVDFFSRSSAWPKKSSPDSYSWKTSPQSEHGDLTALSKNWPISGMSVGGTIYPLSTWGHHTKGTDGGCWVTPRANQPDEDYENRQKRLQAKADPKSNSKVRPDSLAMQVRLPQFWPTPSAQEAGEGPLLEKLQTKDGLPAQPGERAYNPETGQHVQITLNRAVQMWPTPTASDAFGAGSRNLPGSKAHAGVSLTDAVRFGNSNTPRRPEPASFPTPQASDAKHRATQQNTERRIEKGKQVNLDGYVQMWPTPGVPNGGRGFPKDVVWKNGTAYTKDGRKLQVMLENAVKMWPTPTVMDHLPPKSDVALDRMQTEIRPGRTGAPSLKDDRRLLGYEDPLQEGTEWGAAVQKWPTPRASDGEKGGPNQHGSKGDLTLPSAASQSTPVTGSLNPNFVEWLMAYPRDWTVLGARAETWRKSFRRSGGKKNGKASPESAQES